MADVGIITGSDIHEPPGVDPNQEHLRRGKPFAPRLRAGSRTKTRGRGSPDAGQAGYAL
jgi:hypothetical protein